MATKRTSWKDRADEFKWQRDRICQALRMVLADEPGARDFAQGELEKLLASVEIAR